MNAGKADRPSEPLRGPAGAAGCEAAGTPREADENHLPLLTEFKNAASHGERANRLLTMPLSVILRCTGELQATCAATGLAAGERYCALVTAALTARRTPAGELPGDLPDQIATDGAELQILADQWRPVTDEDGYCRRTCFDAETGRADASDGTGLTGDGHCECPETRTAREACPSWRFFR